MLGLPLMRTLQYSHLVQPAAPLNLGLVAWWLVLPGRSGGLTWWDLCGRSHGQLVGMGPSTAVSGWGGTTRPGGYGALRFDGTNDYVGMGDTSPLRLSSGITLALWVKRNRTATREIITGKGDGGGAADTAYWFEYTAADAPRFLLEQDGTTDRGVTAGDLATGDTDWHHLVGTWDGATQRVYVDAIASTTTLSWTGALTQTTSTFSVGRTGGLAALFFQGQVDDVRLYNRGLSASEVATLYQMSRLGYPQALAWQPWARIWAVTAAISGAVPSGIIALWSGTNATIPSGWTRVTALDGRYPKGAPVATDGGGTRGALMHTHTTPTHTHTTAHTHTVPDTTGTSGSSARDTGTTNPPAVHTHASNPAAQNPVTSLATDTPSTDAVNHEPPYYTVIFLASDGTALGFPASVLSLWHEAAGAPAGWGLCDGGAGRPDLRGKYLKGAATAGDGGGTGGGTTHTHTIASHTHATPYAHGHPDVTSSQRTEALTTGTISGGAANVATATHTHTLTITSASPAITANTDAVGSTNHEPSYWLVALIQNTSGALSWPDRLIGLWMGSLGAIPTDWKLCDGTNGTPDLRSLFIKGATTVAGVGSGGGSGTHGHTATGHTHAVAAHVHTVTGGVGASESRTAGATNAPTDTHTHTWPNTGSTSFTSGTETPSVNDYTDTQPPFTNVVFIQWQVPGIQKAPPPARRPWRIFRRAA